MAKRMTEKQGNDFILTIKNECKTTHEQKSEMLVTVE